MSNISKRLCILVAVLVLVTMTGTGVFAADVTTDENGMAVQQEESTGTTDTTGLTSEEDPSQQSDEQTVPPEEQPTVIELDTTNTKIDPIPDQTYTGSPIELDDADLEVVYTDPATQQETELVFGTDYTVSYPGDHTAIGTADVSIVGAGNYTGSVSGQFNIVEGVTAPKAVKKVEALAGYNAIKVTWKPASDKSKVDYYFITRKLNGTVNRTRLTDAKETKSCSWENSKKLKKNKKYVFTVYAVKQVGSRDTAAQLLDNTGDDLISKATKSESTQMVRRMVIKVTMRSTVGKLKAGKTYEATGYGSGQYRISKGGHTYSVARIRCKNQKAIYEKNGEFSHEAVDFFMNGGSTWAKGKEFSYVKSSKFSTSRTYFVWVNTYNQHAYVLKKDGSKWKTVDDWKVSMGKASTPSPTGKKTIIKFRAHHPGHGAPNWNFISWSSRLNHGTALHGLENGWAPKLGTLASHGCIRNPTEKAGQLHSKYSGNGMKVLIY